MGLPGQLASGPVLTFAYDCSGWVCECWRQKHNLAEHREGGEPSNLVPRRMHGERFGTVAAKSTIERSTGKEGNNKIPCPIGSMAREKAAAGRFHLILP